MTLTLMMDYLVVASNLQDRIFVAQAEGVVVSPCHQDNMGACLHGVNHILDHVDSANHASLIGTPLDFVLVRNGIGDPVPNIQSVQSGDFMANPRII